MQLGKGTQQQAMDTRLPDSSDGDDTSPKRRRGEPSRGSKQAKGKNPDSGFDWNAFKQLLQEQKAEIIEANRAHADDLFRGLEAKCEDRFQILEKRGDGVEEHIKIMDTRLGRLEELMKAGGTTVDTTLDAKRRYTLVIGGWNQDTQKRVILNEVDEALQRLDLQKLLDTSPFTTGARRSVALVYFGKREGEGDPERRSRMHEVLQGISQAKAVTSHGKKMWVSFSKSKQERDVSNHCGWLKRSLASFGQEVVDRLDLEYSSGTSWYGEYQVASATRAPPGGVEDTEMVWDDKKICRPWIHVSLLAKATGISQVDLRSALEEFRR